MNETIKYIIKMLPNEIKSYCEYNRNFDGAEEIRFRCGGKSEIVYFNRTVYFDYRADPRFIANLMNMLAQQSLYAYEEQIRRGFLTVKGGHRVGFTGKIHVNHGEIISMDHFSSLNIRIARQVKGAADKLLPFVRDSRGEYSTLIISPPVAGKTTALRDIARQLSQGSDGYRPLKGAIIDERGEIACCYLGEPMLDVGDRCDVMDNCPRDYGIRMVIRSMSPDFIITDEIDTKGDIVAVKDAARSGVKIICSMHKEGIEDIKCVAALRSSPVFERIIRIARNKEGIYPYKVYNKNFEEIYSWD